MAYYKVIMISDVLVLTLACLTFKHKHWFSELPPIGMVSFRPRQSVSWDQWIVADAHKHTPPLWWRTHTPPVKDKHSWLWCGMYRNRNCPWKSTASKTWANPQKKTHGLKNKTKQEQINTKLSHTFQSSNVSLYSLHSLKVVTISEVPLLAVYILYVQSGVEFVYPK